MDNSLFLLHSKVESETKHMERMQICTWDIRNKKTCIEIGIEFCKDSLKTEKSYDIFFFAPWISNKCKIESLHEKFSDSDNAQFIFNEVVESISPIDGSKHNGSIISFKNCERKIAALKASFLIEENGVLKITFTNKSDKDVYPYIRFFIKTYENTFALFKGSISKNIFIFDFKINEKRNMPRTIIETIDKRNVECCDIKKALILHIIPNTYEVVFIDDKKLENIRNLETNFFKKYLPNINGMNNDSYITTFYKDNDKQSYSFFSIFSEEKIGAKQMMIAIFVNIICSALIASSNIRNLFQNEKFSFKLLPVEYTILLCMVIFLAATYSIKNVQKRLISLVNEKGEKK